MCDEGRGVGPEVEGVRRGVYLDFADAIERLGRDGHRGEVRQPLRHVRPDHGRGPLRGADADLPGGPLRDGRPVGRLRPAVDDPRPVRHRRGQLLRPRRQPARRVRADAGPGRRLLRAAEHDPRLPRRGPVRPGPRGPPRRWSRPSSRCRTAIDAFLSTNGTRSVDSYHRELGNIMWEYCGMERTEDGLRKAIDLIRTLRDDFQRNVRVLGTRREPQPVAGEGRPGRGLPRARRADVHRRPQPARVLRRPLPRRVADRGRRGAAPRRPVRLRRGLGVGRRRRGPIMGTPVLHKEHLTYEFVEMKQRSYK